MEFNNRIPVKILDVKDPHRFWFRMESDDCKLQTSLSSYAAAQKVENNLYIPKLNEIVLVKINKRWDVAQVKRFGDHSIDICVIGKTQSQRIRNNEIFQLKDESIKEMAAATIATGSIGGIVPAKKEMNYGRASCEMKPSKCWSAESCTAIRRVLYEAHSVYFEANDFSDDCYYGELMYMKSISKLLLDMDNAIRSQDAITGCNGFVQPPTRLIFKDELDDNSDIHPVINSYTYKPPVKNAMSRITERTEVSDDSKNDSRSLGSSDSIRNIEHMQSDSTTLDNSNGDPKSSTSSQTDTLGSNDTGIEDTEKLNGLIEFEVLNRSMPVELSLVVDQHEPNTTAQSMNERIEGDAVDEILDTFTKLSIKSPEHPLSPLKEHIETSEDNTKETELNESGDSNKNVICIRSDSVEINSSSASIKESGILNENLRAKSLVVEKSEEDVSKITKDDEFNNQPPAPTTIHQVDSLESLCSRLPSYMEVTDISEDEPELHEFSEEGMAKLNEEVEKKAVMELFDGLLKNASLCVTAPITNHESDSIVFDPMVTSKAAHEALNRLNKRFLIQGSVWPHIANGHPTILLGNTEFYPQLLYLPVICGLIEKWENSGNTDQKVIIVASDQNQAKIICKMSASYLGDRSMDTLLVYCNADDYTNDIDEYRFDVCKMFVTLPSWIIANRLKCPKNISHFVVNNFNGIPASQRPRLIEMIKNSKFIITSEYYVNELRQIMIDVPDVFVSVESHYDLFSLTSGMDESRSTEVDAFEPKRGPTMLKLRNKLNKIETLESHWKTVVVCRDLETAAMISEKLKSNGQLNNMLNQKPEGSATRILVCSDDCLMDVGVKAANHLIHYDLPDDFETFSLRYSVLAKSHCSFQNIISTDTPKPSATIFLELKNSNDGKLDVEGKKLLLLLLSRENSLDLDQNIRNRLLKMVQTEHKDAPICTDIAVHLTHIDHLLKCQSRHCFEAQKLQQQPRFPERYTWCAEVQDVLSPIHFKVRVPLIKNRHRILCPHELGDFKKFQDNLNIFYAKTFEALKDATELDKKMLYIVRDGNQYLRCTVLDTNIQSEPGKVRVMLVDFGKSLKAVIPDMCLLKEFHSDFPIQSIDLCLSELVPWNHRNWNQNDTDYVKGLIFGTSSRNEVFGNGSFEINIQFELHSNSIYASNIFSTNPFTKENQDYANLLISKGIAARSSDGFEQFKQHAMETNTLCTTERL